MDTFAWIVLGGVLMSAIALVGSLTLLLPEAALDHLIMPLVAFAAGSLLGGACLHMLPAAILQAPDPTDVFLWTLAGFALFFALEQFLHWHHCHRAASDCKKPGNFLYIGASDLVPEVNKHRDLRSNFIHFGAFVSGIALLWSIREILGA